MQILIETTKHMPPSPWKNGNWLNVSCNTTFHQWCVKYTCVAYSRLSSTVSRLQFWGRPNLLSVFQYFYYYYFYYFYPIICSYCGRSTSSQWFAMRCIVCLQIGCTFWTCEMHFWYFKYNILMLILLYFIQFLQDFTSNRVYIYMGILAAINFPPHSGQSTPLLKNATLWSDKIKTVTSHLFYTMLKQDFLSTSEQNSYTSYCILLVM